MLLGTLVLEETHGAKPKLANVRSLIVPFVSVVNPLMAPSACAARVVPDPTLGVSDEYERIPSPELSGDESVQFPVAPMRLPATLSPPLTVR